MMTPGQRAGQSGERAQRPAEPARPIRNGHTGSGTGTGHKVSAAGTGNGNGHKISAAGAENGHGRSAQHGNGGNGHTGGTGNGNGNGNGNGDGHGSGEVHTHSATAKEQLFEVLHVVFKRWRLITALFLVVAISGLLAVLAREPRYMARAAVMIVADRADTTIQATDQDNLALLKLNEAVVNSEVQVIRSRELIDQVVRGLALAKAGGNVVNIANAADGRQSISKRALLIRQRLMVTPIRNSNVIEIRYDATDPSIAAKVVNRIVDEYLNYHAIVHSPQGLAGFFDEQSTMMLQRLRRAETALSEFATREGIVAPAAEIETAVSSIATIENDLRKRNAVVVGAEEKLRVVRDQLAAQSEIVKRSQQLEVNPVIKQLRDHLVDREVDQVALLRKYTENDRHVRDNQTEISELAAKLNRATVEEPMSVVSETFAANPVFEARLAALLELEAQLRENRALKIALEEDLTRERRRLVTLKQRALEFDHLDQEVQRQRAAVDLYSKRGDEAALENAMDQRKLVNVAVVERPALPLEQTTDQRIPLVLAIVSGLVVALGGAFGVEYLNRTLRFERDVERYLGLPVLGSVAEAKTR
jgi:uncharacterized protein involved in exopolysaccharide biosynthesis